MNVNSKFRFFLICGLLFSAQAFSQSEPFGIGRLPDSNGIQKLYLPFIIDRQTQSSYLGVGDNSEFGRHFAGEKYPYNTDAVQKVLGAAAPELDPIREHFRRANLLTPRRDAHLAILDAHFPYIRQDAHNPWLPQRFWGGTLVWNSKRPHILMGYSKSANMNAPGRITQGRDPQTGQFSNRGSFITEGDQPDVFRKLAGHAGLPVKDVETGAIHLPVLTTRAEESFSLRATQGANVINRPGRAKHTVMRWLRFLRP